MRPFLTLVALLASACGGALDTDAPPFALTPLDPVREAWGTHDGILTAPAEYCGLVMVRDAAEPREILAPADTDPAEVPLVGRACVLLAPGESVGFWTRPGGNVWLEYQGHEYAGDGCALACP